MRKSDDYDIKSIEFLVLSVHGCASKNLIAEFQKYYIPLYIFVIPLYKCNPKELHSQNLYAFPMLLIFYHLELLTILNYPENNFSSSKACCRSFVDKIFMKTISVSF